MKSAYKNILKATTLFGGVRAVNILIGLIRTKFVAILLGPAGVGLNSIYNGARDLLHCSTSLGIDISGINEISKKYERLHSAECVEDCRKLKRDVEQSVCVLRSWTMLLALIGTLLTIALSQPLSFFTFHDGEHAIYFVWLSPAVGLSTLALGETAILQAVRKLKVIASISLLTTLAGSIVSISLYYFWGLGGIVPALVCIYLCNVTIITAFSFRAYPLHLDFTKKNLGTGLSILKIGGSIVLVNALGSFLELATQSTMQRIGSIDNVGLYSANKTLINAFVGIFIAAIASDFFPRLAGVFLDREQRQIIVSRQTCFLLLVAPPAINLFLFFLPVIVPLLYSEAFYEVIPLMRITLIALIFRIVSIPFSYTPLAAGDSKTYFLLGIVQASDMILMIPGYYWWGLMGVGVMILVANVIDFFIAAYLSFRKYGIRMSHDNFILMAAQTIILCVSYFAAADMTGVGYWVIAFMITSISLICSYHFYRHAE